MNTSIKVTWQPLFVIISFIVSFFGTISALYVCEQYRLSSKEYSSKIYSKSGVGLAWALSVGGIALWAMSVIAVSAVQLSLRNGELVQIRFRLDLLLSSLVITCLFCMFGIVLGTKDKVFSIHKVEALDVYVRDNNNMTIGEMRKTKNRNSIVFKTLFKNVGPLFVGGLTFGTGVLIADYVVLSSLVMDECIIEWNVGIVVGVSILGTLGGSIVCWILFRLLALYPSIERLRLACGFICSTGICAVRYLAVGVSSKLKYVPGKTNPPLYLSYTTADVDEVVEGVIITSVIFTFITLLVLIIDSRGWFYRLTKLFRLVGDMVERMDKSLSIIEGIALKDLNTVDTKILISECRDFVSGYRTLLNIEVPKVEVQKDTTVKREKHASFIQKETLFKNKKHSSYFVAGDL